MSIFFKIYLYFYHGHYYNNENNRNSIFAINYFPIKSPTMVIMNLTLLYHMNLIV